MSNPENPDECLAKEWLKSQGYTDIRRPEADPPDYVVKVGDCCHAAEVIRLSLGKESKNKPLRKVVLKVLKEFNESGERKRWYVNCEYNSSISLPPPEIVQRDLWDALEELAQSNTQCEHVEMPLPCGIRLRLSRGSPFLRQGFVLNDVSDGMGCYVLGELTQGIQSCIEKKTPKIECRKKSLSARDYDSWWLLLLDHIGHVPESGLGAQELEMLRQSVQVPDSWDRVVVVSRFSPCSGYEIRRQTSTSSRTNF